MCISFKVVFNTQCDIGGYRFSLSGKTISAGAGILVYLDITGDINNACIDNVIISDPTGTALTVNHDCTTIQIP